MGDIGSSQVKGYLAYRRGAGARGKPLSNRTIQKDRTVLHTVFSYAQEIEWIDRNPVSVVKAPRPDPRSPVILSDGDLKAALEACNASSFQLYFYVLLLAETGMRCESEALWLCWEDIDFSERLIRVVSGRDGHRTKSGRSRTVPISEGLIAAMKAYRTALDGLNGGMRTAWVFPHIQRRPGVLAGDRIGTMRSAFKRAAARAGLSPDLHLHDLRHRRATTWLAKGKNPVLVRDALGHADLRTTMGYTHLNPAHLRSLVE